MGLKSEVERLEKLAAEQFFDGPIREALDSYMRNATDAELEAISADSPGAVERVLEALRGDELEQVGTTK